MFGSQGLSPGGYQELMNLQEFFKRLKGKFSIFGSQGLSPGGHQVLMNLLEFFKMLKAKF